MDGTTFSAPAVLLALHDTTNMDACGKHAPGELVVHPAILKQTNPPQINYDRKGDGEEGESPPRGEKAIMVVRDDFKIIHVHPRFWC